MDQPAKVASDGTRLSDVGYQPGTHGILLYRVRRGNERVARNLIMGRSHHRSGRYIYIYKSKSNRYIKLEILTNVDNKRRSSRGRRMMVERSWKRSRRRKGEEVSDRERATTGTEGHEDVDE